jgi:hypothetical protein
MNGVPRSCPILQNSFPFGDRFGKNEDSMICFKRRPDRLASLLTVVPLIDWPGLKGRAADPIPPLWHPAKRGAASLAKFFLVADTHVNQLLLCEMKIRASLWSSFNPLLQGVKVFPLIMASSNTLWARHCSGISSRTWFKDYDICFLCKTICLA